MQQPRYLSREDVPSNVQSIEYVNTTYKDDVIAITTGDWDNHLEKTRRDFKTTSKCWTKSKCKEISLWKHKLEYLGYWVT